MTSASWGSRTPWAPWFLRQRAPLEIWPSALNWGALTKRTHGTIPWRGAPPCTATSTAHWVHSTRVMETQLRNLEEPARIRPETTLSYPVNDFLISLMTSLEKLCRVISRKQDIKACLHTPEEKRFQLRAWTVVLFDLLSVWKNTKTRLGHFLKFSLKMFWNTSVNNLFLLMFLFL